MLAGVICGNRYEEHWNLAKETVDFYDLKGDLESVLDLTGKLNEVEFRAEANPALHPGQSAAIYLKGERIGFVGVVHPELERKLDLNGRTLVFELEWNKLADRVVPQAREISRFPANRRDIAVVVAENVPAADILSECKKVGVNQVVGVNLFDVYRGKGVAEGYKSLAISLILQDTSRTLEEEEIAATVAKCVEALKERFQASLRIEPMALTKAEMSEYLFDKLGLSKRDAKELVELFFEEIRRALENGEQVKLSGFGNFDLRDKNQRPGRNPKTGEDIPITARRVVTFRPGQKLKSRVENASPKDE